MHEIIVTVLKEDNIQPIFFLAYLYVCASVLFYVTFIGLDPAAFEMSFRNGLEVVLRLMLWHGNTLYIISNM